ncbi:MAG TPA: hypothetical protein VKT70_05015 [Stellaceae bacterium]|nr:hypothetical protein [Stellaceae bacterium]
MMGARGQVADGRRERGSWGALFFSLMVPAALAACAGLSPPTDEERGPQAVVTPLIRDPLLPEEVAPPSPASPRPADLGALRGLPERDVLAALGEPTFRRAEPPAELWQYRTSDCVVDVFLYQEADGYRVVEIESRDRSLPVIHVARCARSGTQAASPLNQTQTLLY